MTYNSGHRLHSPYHMGNAITYLWNPYWKSFHTINWHFLANASYNLKWFANPRFNWFSNNEETLTAYLIPPFEHFSIFGWRKTSSQLQGLQNTLVPSVTCKFSHIAAAGMEALWYSDGRVKTTHLCVTGDFSFWHGKVMFIFLTQFQQIKNLGGETTLFNL